MTRIKRFILAFLLILSFILTMIYTYKLFVAPKPIVNPTFHGEVVR